MSQTEYYPYIFELVNSYTHHKILQSRFSHSLQKYIDGEASCPPQFASSVIKFLGEDLAAECGQKIKAILSTAAADRIIAEHANLFSDNTYGMNFRVSTPERLPFLVNDIGDVIFKEKQGVHVGRVAAFLAFGATFGAYCEQQQGLGQMAVEKIVDSVVKYMDCNLKSWLKRNGGLSMLQSAKVESFSHFTASKKQKADFAESLKHLVHNTSETKNPQFYSEMSKLILELENILGIEENVSGQETGLEQALSSFCVEGNIREETNAEKHTKNEEVVPPEINLRGRLAVEAYNKALAEGKTCVKRVPVMFIGQDRAGKTSLKKSLMGQPFNPDEGSTVGIDVDPSLFEISTEIWRTGERDQGRISEGGISFEHHAARLVVSKLNEEESVPSERTEEVVRWENIPVTDTVHSNVQAGGVSNQTTAEVRTENSHNNGPSLDIVIGNQNSEITEGAGESHQIPGKVETDKTEYFPEDALPIIPDATQTRTEDPASPKIPEEVERLIKKLLQKGSKEKDEEDGIYSVLWDFGGQSVYYTTHPLFLTTRAIYLLVYDLSRNPYETAKPVVKQGLFKKVEDSFSRKTNLDYLDFWMNSVASLVSQGEAGQINSGPRSAILPEKLPPVFLVCTHADGPYDGKEPLAAAREVFGSLQSKPYKSFLYDDVFVVDNRKSGLEFECSEVARLREKLLAVAKELPQMKEVIPIKWLKYEKAIQVAVEEGHKLISLERAKHIASEVCKIYDNQEFVTLLNFFHDQRILIHFDETAVLNSLVILDPQWLIDVFKKVITVQPYVHENKEVKERWHKLETTGILDESLLQHVWGSLIHHHDTFESLIAIMEKFSLLCPWPVPDSSCTKEYLVPSMLLSYPPQDIIKLVASARIPSLFLRFKSGQVPPGLFPRLILQLFQCGKTEFWSPVNPQLYLNFARFYTFEDQDCSVVLFCHSGSIEVVVHRGNLVVESVDSLHSSLNSSASGHYDAFEVASARAVCRQLVLMLECMRNEFNWLRNMKYELGVICPVCSQGGVVNYCRTHHKQGCEREECLHFWSTSELSSADRVVCTKVAAALNNRVDANLFAPWLAAEGKQDLLLGRFCVSSQETPSTKIKLAIDEHDGRVRLPDNRGNGNRGIAIPDTVMESMLSASCDPREVVHQLKLSLQWDQASLEDPTPENKRLIRYLATTAKFSNRLDVVKYLREITPAGTAGPLLSDHLDIRNVPVGQMREITIDLSGGDQWKDVAEKLGLSPNEIRFLERRTLNPCDAALAFLSQRSYLSVGYLYDVLTECGLPVIADLL